MTMTALRTVAALFVREGGCYFDLPGVDPWCESRDARLYGGPHPVVAHPPSGRWCALARLNEARWGAKVGDDGGCFESALASVRRWRGVLEHPASSLAWDAFSLPKPTAAGWSRAIGDPGWSCEVSQAAYGHAARKLTWLYYVGDAPPPPLDWSRPKPRAWVSKCANHGTGGGLPRLVRAESLRTPPAFRDVLLAMARSARGSDARGGS